MSKSSFEDTFSKSGAGDEDAMDYDDSAFYYFSFLILTIVLLPITWGIIKSVIWGDFKIEALPA